MNDRKVLRSLVMVTQVGINMMVPIFICGAIGYWLTGYFKQDLIFLVALIIGVGAAIRNMYILMKSFFEKDLRQEKKQRDYIEGLKNYRNEHPDEDFSNVMEGKKKRYSDTKGPTRN